MRESNPRAVADDTFPRCCITALPTFQESYYTLLKKLVSKYFYLYYRLMSSKYTDELVSILKMLQNIEEDLNLIQYSETEKKIYYTIACKNANDGSCCISDVIEESGFSRSTVYKTIKKFEEDQIIKMFQSSHDKREFNLVLAH